MGHKLFYFFGGIKFPPARADKAGAAPIRIG